MKILFVSLFLPQEKAYHAGGRYVFELLRNLSQRHEIHLVTRLEKGEEPFLADLAPYCAKIDPYPYPRIDKRDLIGSLRLAANYLGFSRHADWLVQTGKYDLIQVEWVESAILIGRGKIPMVLDAHDVITKPARRALSRATGFSRLVLLAKYLLVRSVERSIMRRFRRIFTLSEYDRNFLLESQPGLPVTTVPIPAGLDIRETTYPRERNRLVFLASYKYRPVNVDAALYFYREVLPLIRRERPEVEYVIAGFGPPEALTGLAGSDPKVTVTGFVDDTDRLYKTAGVFVAPILTGGGIIVKVLDALAAGAPVVTTSFGNEGIGAHPGRDLLIADAAEPFAEAVLSILRDDRLAQQLSENGREFVRKNFGLEAVMAKIEREYAEIVSTPPRK